MNDVVIKIGCYIWIRTYFWLNRSGLKFILHCTANTEISERSCFRLILFMVIFCMVENKELLSAKGFGLDFKPFGKSFV